MTYRTFQIRRGEKGDLPAPLSLAELGFCTDTKEVYIGNGSTNTIVNPLIGLNGSNGITTKTADDTFAVRTITAGSFISVSNGDGISGNPTISVLCKDEDTMSSNSDQHTATQQSIKAYVDNQVSGSTSTFQAGVESISNASSTVSVTLPTAYSDTNYAICYGVQNTTDGTPSQYAMVITAKSTTGFTVTLSGTTDSANYSLDWITQSFTP